MLFSIRICQEQENHISARLCWQLAREVKTMTGTDDQAGWTGLVPPEDDRAFERPNREAEMESVGEQNSSSPAAQGERRSGGDRRHMPGRRGEDRENVRP